jgi:hypothetical protein
MRDDRFSAMLRSGAERVAATVNPPPASTVRRRGDFRRRRNMAASGALALVLGGVGGGVAYASLSTNSTNPSQPLAGGTQSPGKFGALQSPAAAPARPGIAAITTQGDVVVMDPGTGMATRTLVAGVDAIGDTVSVSKTTVYFAVRSKCVDKVESVPLAGGPVTVIADGAQPEVSPDGTQLAYVRGPDQWPGACNTTQPGLTSYADLYLVVRDLATGSDRQLPPPPWVVSSQIPAPISHLSWSSDSSTLLVSIQAGQDNQGWDLVTVDPATAQYYLPTNWRGNGTGAPGTSIPVTGTSGSYYFQGVWGPGGDLFVDKVCCGGVPVKNKSNELEVITPGGASVRHVAYGVLTHAHTSLDVDPTGKWLLYLSDNELFLQTGTGAAFELTTDVVAATWR